MSFVVMTVLAAACAGVDEQSADSAVAATAAATTITTSTTTTSDAPTASVAPTTTSTSVPWQQFPLGPVPALPPRSIQSFSRVDTTDPVVFLTIDDGFVRDPRVPALLAEHGAPATLFLIAGSVTNDPEYFRRFVELGGTINSHTIRHAYLPGMSKEAQQDEICGMRQQIEATFGVAGHFFRPPRGEFDEATFAAARGCDLRAMVLWRVSVTDGVIDTWGTSPINPGDIILLHFLSTTYDSLVVLFAELDRLGLTVARLEDYLPAA